MRRAIWMALAFMGTAPLVALAQQQNTGTAPAASPSGAGSIERGQDTTATQAPGAPGQQSAGSVGTAQGQPAAGGAGTGGGGRSEAKQAPSGMDPAAMRRELSMLRQRVASLEAEVDALRGLGGAGTGGAGTGGDTGTTDTADVQVQGPVTVAIAVFDGRVVDVTRRHIDIVDTSDGAFYRLTLDDQTKAFVGPDLKRIPVEQLPEGAQVRTSFALISGVEHARNIVTQPQRPRQQRQEQQQRLQQQRRERMGPGQRLVVPPQQTPRQE